MVHTEQTEIRNVMRSLSREVHGTLAVLRSAAAATSLAKRDGSLVRGVPTDDGSGGGSGSLPGAANTRNTREI
jgi:hypothetical protein